MAYPLTEAGYIHLRNQLGHYESIEEMILQDRVSTAHQVVMGDSTTLSPELAEKRQRLAVINNIICKIRGVLNNHYILELPQPEEGKVTVGSVITLTYPNEEEVDVMLLDVLPGSTEDICVPFPDVKIATLCSPIGSALFNCKQPLMSAKEGDKVVIKLPKGDVELTVSAVYTPTLTEEAMAKEKPKQRKRS